MNDLYDFLTYNKSFITCQYDYGPNLGICIIDGTQTFVCSLYNNKKMERRSFFMNYRKYMNDIVYGENGDVISSRMTLNRQRFGFEFDRMYTYWQSQICEYIQIRVSCDDCYDFYNRLTHMCRSVFKN